MVIGLLNFHSLFNSLNDWLESLFSDGCISRGGNGDVSENCFILNLGIIGYLFGVDWSVHGFLSQDWSLDDSLFYDGLRNHLSCDDGLFIDRLVNNCSSSRFKGLGDDWFGVINFTSILSS